VILAGRDDPRAGLAVERERGRPQPPGLLKRGALALCAIVALAAISVPLAGAIAVRQSQAAAQEGNLAAAYHDSLTAERLQPYAGTPYLQEALVLESAGDLGQAAAAAQIATRHEPTDWQVWLTLARIDAERGFDRSALTALDRARALNPLGNVFVAT